MRSLVILLSLFIVFSCQADSSLLVLSRNAALDLYFLDHSQGQLLSFQASSLGQGPYFKMRGNMADGSPLCEQQGEGALKYFTTVWQQMKKQYGDAIPDTGNLRVTVGIAGFESIHQGLLSGEVAPNPERQKLCLQAELNYTTGLLDELSTSGFTVSTITMDKDIDLYSSVLTEANREPYTWLFADTCASGVLVEQGRVFASKTAERGYYTGGQLRSTPAGGYWQSGMIALLSRYRHGEFQEKNALRDQMVDEFCQHDGVDCNQSAEDIYNYLGYWLINQSAGNNTDWLTDLKSTNQAPCSEVLDAIYLENSSWFNDKPAGSLPLKVYGSYSRWVDLQKLDYRWGKISRVSDQQFELLVKGYLEK